MSKLNRTLCSWCKDKKTCPQRKRIEKIFNGIDKLIGDEKPSYLIILKIVHIIRVYIMIVDIQEI
jgi:hypothetical protein